ncbi:MAG: hypothetical protein NTW03_16480, partial [Verrucomicrobia bacterium]|nr:hypothetical protein [Verrucomicrobiota bacterium]
ATICIPDDTVPANPGTICFYGQLFDENGNASPLVRFACLDIGTAGQLPVPLLASLSSSGDTNAPGMNAVWFCPPSGLDRFEVWIGVKLGSPAPPLALSPQLAFSNALPVTLAVTNNNTNASYTFYEYRTPHIGQSFGNGTPQFLVVPAIQIGRPYAVFVKAVGKHGGIGEPSNIETFQWKTTNTPGPQVPWPARPLPSTNTTFAGFAFFLSPTNANAGVRAPDTGVGVLIGFAATKALRSGRSRFMACRIRTLTWPSMARARAFSRSCFTATRCRTATSLPSPAMSSRSLRSWRTSPTASGAASWRFRIRSSASPW